MKRTRSCKPQTPIFKIFSTQQSSSDEETYQRPKSKIYKSDTFQSDESMNDSAQNASTNDHSLRLEESSSSEHNTNNFIGNHIAIDTILSNEINTNTNIDMNLTSNVNNNIEHHTSDNNTTENNALHLPSTNLEDDTE